VVAGGAFIGMTFFLESDSNLAPAASPSPTPATPTRGGIADIATPVVADATPAVRRSGTEALVEVSVADLSGYIHRREVSVESLVEAAQQRISQYDETYGAVIELNPDASAIARELDAELAQGRSRGPLHGVPIVLKDVIATGDAMATTSGSLALADNPVVADAKLVQRLRNAGLVILGKTNMTEWSNVRGGGQIFGRSDRGGQTRNPYDPEMSPWGSSSGSAAAVALSYTPLAMGSETNGSIIAPAAACGVVGLKPTVGLVSRAGVMPVTLTLDSPGPMARSVADVAALLNVIAGFDPDDVERPMTWALPAADITGAPHDYDAVDYLASLDAEGLKGARIGVCWQLWNFDPEADAVAQKILLRMQEAGATLVDGVEIPSLSELEGAPQIFTMVNTEFAAGMASFFDRYMPDGPVSSLADVVEWNLAHADQTLDQLGQEGLAETVDALSLDDPFYQDAVAYLTTIARSGGMDIAMDTNDLDAIVAPTAGVPTEIIDGQAPLFPGSSAQAAAISGYPSLSLPIGYVRGLPVGMHFSGRAFSEQVLIRIAHSLEQLLKVRTAPPLQDVHS
jgi:amidase